MNGNWGASRWARGRMIFRGWMARVVATVGLLVGGLVGVVLYLAFWAGRFPWYQNLAVVFSTLLVVPVIVFVMWVHWGVSVARRVRTWVEDPFDP
jgi:ABC-type spermidine/putrescine transport system permease subunit II